MLYNILYSHAEDWWSALNLFKYITFRSIGALFTAFFVSFFMGPFFIKTMRRYQKRGQPIRDDGPQSHLLTKQGTPTMGGALMLMTLTVSTLLWANLENAYVWIVLFVTLGFGAIGFYDDFLKVRKYSPKGISGKLKIVLQLIISCAAIKWMHGVMPENLHSTMMVPFLKNGIIDLGVFFIPFACLVMIGSSNAVNLTDGLDGLAIGPVIIATLCFSLIVYVTGNHNFANYLHVNYIPGSGEVAIFCGALVGAGLGFLWFNAPPAMVFMGDTGSLAIGGALGTMSVMTGSECILFIVGGLFVMEAVSVIMQVGYFKLTKGRRIFLMAPLHHHFEKKGWSEPTIVIRFWIISILLALMGLSSLKLR